MQGAGCGGAQRCCGTNEEVSIGRKAMRREDSRRRREAIADKAERDGEDRELTVRVRTSSEKPESGDWGGA